MIVLITTMIVPTNQTSSSTLWIGDLIYDVIVQRVYRCTLFPILFGEERRGCNVVMEACVTKILSASMSDVQRNQIFRRRTRGWMYDGRDGKMAHIAHDNKNCKFHHPHSYRDIRIWAIAIHKSIGNKCKMQIPVANWLRDLSLLRSKNPKFACTGWLPCLDF